MPKLGLGLGLTKGGKRAASYKATGTGLSPDINGKLFYLSGTFNSRPQYVSDDGYYLWYSGAAWIINKTRSTALGQSTFGQTAPSTEVLQKTYQGTFGFTGTVTVVNA